MQTILAFILVFGLIVFFHELGHFIFAKRSGILVREFAIGMGPKIFGMKKGETLYTIRLLPLGGYVRMAGEEFDQIELQPGYRVGLVLNDDEKVEKIYLNQNVQNPNVLFMEVERADLNKDLWIEGYDEEERFVRFDVDRNAIIIENGEETVIAPFDRTFEAKSLWQRTLTIFAGPLFNFILAFVIFIFLGIFQGVPTNEPIISEVMDDSPAAEAGMKAGDYVKSINGHPIDKWEDLTNYVKENPGKELSMIVERGGQEAELTVVPEYVELENGEKVGQIGVIYQSPLEKNPIKAVVYGFQQTWEYTVLILQALVHLIAGHFSLDDLAGPVGIYQATGEVAKHGFFTLMYWTAALSINLGIMNLLPLPALDGGRLMFFSIEALRGKPVDRKKEGMVHFVGIVLLMILMIAVTWNDIQRLFFHQ
ncbi:RIP metalloprotease RseP [Ureibacillus terrenus]|uniref:RIP metalloprotease RseP n=1 Tax=Ureibacillus terrenus TaxID=118246 RepID=UPI002E23CF76|nr:RIP metalloprotease RseP [Ureibacillus terrenus]